MDQEAIKNEMRLHALEILTVTNFSIACLETASPLMMAGEVHGRMQLAARKSKFPGDDPAMSDLLSAELEAAVSRLVAMGSEQIKLALKRDQRQT